MFKFILEETLNKKNVTRYALCKKTGIDPNTINKIYHGTAKQIRLETLEKICEALECELSDIIVKKDK